MCMLCDMKAAGANAEVLAMGESLMMLLASAMQVHAQLSINGKAEYTEGQREVLQHIKNETNVVKDKFLGRMH